MRARIKLTPAPTEGAGRLAVDVKQGPAGSLELRAAIVLAGRRVTLSLRTPQRALPRA